MKEECLNQDPALRMRKECLNQAPALYMESGIGIRIEADILCCIGIEVVDIIADIIMKKSRMPDERLQMDLFWVGFGVNPGGYEYSRRI